MSHKCYNAFFLQVASYDFSAYYFFNAIYLYRLVLEQNTFQPNKLLLIFVYGNIFMLIALQHILLTWQNPVSRAYQLILTYYSSLLSHNVNVVKVTDGLNYACLMINFKTHFFLFRLNLLRIWWFSYRYSHRQLNSISEPLFYLLLVIPYIHLPKKSQRYQL